MQIGIIYKWIIYIEKAQNKDTKNQKVIGNIHKIIIGIVNNNSTKTEYIIALLKKYLLKTGIFIGTVYNKERNKKMDIWEKIKRKGFNWWVTSRTKKAQEKYGFDMKKHEYSYSNTHNNEADAFKHAYISWFLAWHAGDKKAKELGDMHRRNNFLY